MRKPTLIKPTLIFSSNSSSGLKVGAPYQVVPSVINAWSIYSQIGGLGPGLGPTVSFDLWFCNVLGTIIFMLWFGFWSLAAGFGAIRTVLRL